MQDLNEFKQQFENIDKMTNDLIEKANGDPDNLSQDERQAFTDMITQRGEIIKGLFGLAHHLIDEIEKCDAAIQAAEEARHAEEAGSEENE